MDYFALAVDITRDHAAEVLGDVDGAPHCADCGVELTDNWGDPHDMFPELLCSDCYKELVNEEGEGQ